MSLTIVELEEKIERAKKDLEQVRAFGDGGRKSEMLQEYIDMLEEELADARRTNC